MRTVAEWERACPRRAAFDRMVMMRGGLVRKVEGWLSSVARLADGTARRGALRVVWDAYGRCRLAAGGVRVPRGDVRWDVFPRDGGGDVIAPDEAGDGCRPGGATGGGFESPRQNPVSPRQNPESPRQDPGAPGRGEDV